MHVHSFAVLVREIRHTVHKVTHFSVVIHTNHYISDKEIEAVERSQYWCSSTFRCPPQYHNIHLAFQLEKQNC